jgi:hypothetical protein
VMEKRIVSIELMKLKRFVCEFVVQGTLSGALMALVLTRQSCATGRKIVWMDLTSFRRIVWRRRILQWDASKFCMENYPVKVH